MRVQDQKRKGPFVDSRKMKRLLGMNRFCKGVDLGLAGESQEFVIVSRSID